MAKELTYVAIAKFSVAKIFDDRFKAKLPARMQKVAARLIDAERSAFTTKTPKDKSAPGFYLDGSLRLAMVEKGGRVVLAGELKGVLATWPKKSMFAFPTGKAKLEGSAKTLQGDVEALVDALVTSVVKDQAVKELKRRAKKM